MPIDWFTVAAQVVNFLVLVWLLKRLLYRPILDAIDAREKETAAALAGAAAADAQVEQARAALTREQAELAGTRERLLQQAEADAQAERARLLAQLRDDDARQRQAAQAALDAQWRSQREQFARSTAQQALAVAGQALGALADASLDQQMCALLQRRLAALDAPGRAALQAALAAAGGAMLVRSAAPLAAAQREALRQALAAGAGQAPALRFETAPQLLAGIELQAGGYRLAWSAADYLEQIGQGLEAALAPPTAGAAP